MLRGTTDARRYLHSKIGVVLTWEHFVRYDVQNLSQFRGVVLANSENDGLPDLATDRVPERVFQKRFAEKLIRAWSEKTLFKLPLFERFCFVLALFVFELDGEALIGQEFGRDFGPRVDDRRTD